MLPKNIIWRCETCKKLRVSTKLPASCNNCGGSAFTQTPLRVVK